jgi:hypothetical protein
MTVTSGQVSVVGDQLISYRVVRITDQVVEGVQAAGKAAKTVRGSAKPDRGETLVGSSRSQRSERTTTMLDIPDVNWNHAAADAASAALRRAAGELRRTAGERSRAAQEATTEWRGEHRNTFDEYLRKTLSEAEALAQRYDEAAARIDRASAQALEEQARRDRAREEARQQTP